MAGKRWTIRWGRLMCQGMGLRFLALVSAFLLWGDFSWGSPTTPSKDPDPMSGMPSRDELKRRRARATNAPVSFVINSTTQRLEARDVDGAMLEEYSPGTVGRVLDASGYELRISFGRDEKRRLSLMVRPGPAQSQPVMISVFRRRLILPPGTSVSAFMERDGEVVTIEPCLTGVIYYLDAEPTSLDVPPDKVQLIKSKNLVRINRDVQQGRLPDQEMIDAVVQGPLQTEEKQTPKNNAGLAVGAWFQNAGVSLMGLPNPQRQPAATVVKVSSSTPELSAPSPQALTPNFDPSLVPTERNQANQELTQSVKVIALRPDSSQAVLSRKPLSYEEGSAGDLQVASRSGLSPRPLEDPSLVSKPPGETLNQKPIGDVTGNAVVRVLRSFLGLPEATTVEKETRQLSGATPAAKP
jgi:hypothetical protein